MEDVYIMMENIMLAIGKMVNFMVKANWLAINSLMKEIGTKINRYLYYLYFSMVMVLNAK